MRAHEACYAVLANAMALAPEHLVHAGTAVGAAAFKVNDPNLGGKRLVLALTLATLARAPGVIPRSRDPVDPAHQRESVLHPVYFDELEDFRFRSEANRMAFFKSSCSSLSTL